MFYHICKALDELKSSIIEGKKEQAFHEKYFIQGNCNFDLGSWLNDCSYRQRKDDDLDWQWGSSSGQPATGPQHDHTLGSNGKGPYQHEPQLFIFLCFIYLFILDFTEI